MLVEHTFITTRPASDALDAAGALLAGLQFFVENPHEPTANASRQWRRGKLLARRATYLADLPQRVRIDFDRGRVSVAGFVELRHQRQHAARDVMVAITVALEQLLAQQKPVETASAQALALQARVSRIDRTRRIILWSAVGAPVLLGLAALLFFTIRDIAHTVSRTQPARMTHR
jgi:hypothetical protein